MKKIGFKYAINGLKHMFAEESNARWHLLASILVISAGIFFRITSIQWILIIICIGSVISAEAFNTAIERVCNHVSPQKNQLIGHAKDVAAGAVLILALMSFVIAAIIFIPYIYQLII